MIENIYNRIDSVLIIGNGFDKSCGLKTGYHDVYKEYIVTPSRNSVIEDFKNNISKDIDKWSDFELEMSLYARSFNSEDSFIECLDDFNGFMHKYLKDIQFAFYQEWNKVHSHYSVISSFVDSMNSLGHGITHNIDNLLNSKRIPNINSIGVISFNYTDVFDTLLDFSYDKSFHHKPVHVHGLLGDDTVLGMDRIEQLDVNYSISDRFKRHFIKPYFNSEYDSERVNTAANWIAAANSIFVYGASLGESDLYWRELLIEWLCKDVNHHLFIYRHSNSTQTFETIAKRLDFEDEQKKKLLIDWKVNLDEKVQGQLHLPSGIKLFEIERMLKEDFIKFGKAEHKN